MVAFKSAEQVTKSISGFKGALSKHLMPLPEQALIQLRKLLKTRVFYICFVVLRRYRNTRQFNFSKIFKPEKTNGCRAGSDALTTRTTTLITALALTTRTH